MIYLASPYTHTNPTIVEKRYKQTIAAMAYLLGQGKFVYSPIVHCHVIATEHNLQTDYLFWKEYNEHFLDLSNEIIVLCLDGWEESKGIAHEIDYCTNKNKIITYMNT